MLTQNKHKNKGFTVFQLLIVIGAIGALFVSLILFDVEQVQGNQMGVKETWDEGVLPQPLTPKTYFLFPGFTQEIFKYDMGLQIYVMNDKNDREEYAEGRKSDAYVVQSKDQQDMRISLRIQWRRLQETVVELHKNARDQVEERIIRPVLLNVVKNQATLCTALEAYSGQGLVNLQNNILKDLQNSHELNRFIRIESFTIEHIGLNKEYTDQIVARQVAVQGTLRANEETKQKLAEADKAKAAAQSDYEKQIVEAKRDFEKGVLEAKKTAEQQVLAAEADAKKVSLTAEAEKNRNVLIALGEKEAAENRAQAILAVGKAEAESKRLQLLAYSGAGADSFVKIEVARSLGLAFSNVKGYLPSNVNYSTVGRDFNGAVNALVGNTDTVGQNK